MSKTLFTDIYSILCKDDDTTLHSLLEKSSNPCKFSSAYINLAIELGASNCITLLHQSNIHTTLNLILELVRIKNGFNLIQNDTLSSLIQRFHKILLLETPESLTYLRVKGTSQEIACQVLKHDLCDAMKIFKILLPTLEHAKIFIGFIKQEVVSNMRTDNLCRFLLRSYNSEFRYIDLLSSQEHARILESIMLNQTFEKSNEFADPESILQTLTARPLQNKNISNKIFIENYQRTLNLINLSYVNASSKPSENLISFLNYLSELDNAHNFPIATQRRLFSLILGGVNIHIYLQLPAKLMTKIIGGIFMSSETVALSLVKSITEYAAFPRMYELSLSRTSNVNMTHLKFKELAECMLLAIKADTARTTKLGELVITSMTITKYPINAKNEFAEALRYLKLLGELPEYSSTLKRLKNIVPTQRLRLVDYFSLITFSDKELTTLVECENSAEVILTLTSMSPLSLLACTDCDEAKGFLAEVIQNV